MSAFDIAEARILIALFIAHHSEHRQLLSWKQLEAEYHVKVGKLQFEAIAAELADRGVVKVFRGLSGSNVVLLDQGVRFAHDRILQFLDADTFEVNWKTERILTDAEGDTDIPCREGWMLLHMEKDRKPQRDRAPVRPAVATSPAIPHGISAGRDVIMNVGSHGATAHGSGGQNSGRESGWSKWQTVLTAFGVLATVAGIVITWTLAH